MVFLYLTTNLAFACDKNDKPWVNYFTRLIAQEMDCLERRTPLAVKEALIKECEPEATFKEITQHLNILIRRSHLLQKDDLNQSQLFPLGNF